MSQAKFVRCDALTAMRGVLDGGYNRISNVAPPQLFDDVATKNYVDTHVPSWADDAIHDATSKPSPVNADEFGFVDSENGYALAKLTFNELKLALKAYFDSLYTGSSSTAIGTWEISEEPS